MEQQTGDLLRGIADLVAEQMPEIQARRYDITWKADGSPVTQADLLLERLIHAYVRERLPDLTFVGEESFDPATLGTGTYLALLDPIDGTENFCSGLKEWGVSFGLWRSGQHLGSMLLLPELGERMISGDPVQKVRSRITGFSSSFSEQIVEQMREVAEARIMGCAVYNLYNVVRGAYSRFSNPKGAYAWDLLPGLMLALEHGCDVKVDGETFDGSLLEPGRKYRVDIQHRYDLHPG